MRHMWWLPVIFLIAGCSNNRPNWPGRLLEISGCSDARKASILQAVDGLNKEIGETVVSPDIADGFPIRFKCVDTDPTHQTRAGFTTLTDTDCTTEFYSLLFQPGNEDYVLPVVTHELGHCSGLEHDPRPGQIMYAVTSQMKTYSHDALETFFDEFLGNIKLAKP